jgi:hypothetical protein
VTQFVIVQNQLRAQGATVTDEDVERLSLGARLSSTSRSRYHFALPEAVVRGGFRPLRDAADADDDFDAGSLSRESVALIQIPARLQTGSLSPMIVRFDGRGRVAHITS